MNFTVELSALIGMIVIGLIWGVRLEAAVNACAKESVRLADELEKSELRHDNSTKSLRDDFQKVMIGLSRIEGRLGVKSDE